LELLDRFIRSDEPLSQLPAGDVRRNRAEQGVIAELEPERGLQSLPRLLADPEDRRRALAVLEEVVVPVELTAEQRAMLERIRAVLGEAPARPRLAAVNGAAPEPAGAT
jgi:hypothetical protein